MASKHGEESGTLYTLGLCTLLGVESKTFTNILVVKGTVRTEMKDICVKATVITLPSFGIDCL